MTTPAKPSASDSDGPKTETTLTTRIRINIPGSRPIPPVVVRTPMPETAAEPEPAPAAAPASAPEEAPAAEEPTSNWFAPRKAAAGPGPVAGPVAGPLPTRALPPGRGPGQTPGQGQGPGPGAPAGGSSAPRYDTPAQGFAQPPAGPRTGGPAGPGQSAGQYPGQGGPGQGFGQGPGQGPGSGQRPGAPALPAAPGAAYGTGPGPGAPVPGAPHPAGPGFGVPAGNRPVGGPGVGTTQGIPPYGPGPGAPAGPTGGPALGTVPVGEPQEPRWPGPELGAGAAYPAPGPGPAPGVDRGPGPATAAYPAPGLDPELGAPAPAPAKDKAKAPARPAKKGRSKLLLLVVAAFSLFGVAYGAGLLLNHSDVPKGTTVLGVDISGTRDEAVAKLQTSFGNRAAGPIQLTVGGKPVELKPEKAGLSLDSQTTVRNAAGSDYNPVTVIGSLFGSARETDPVMPVDDEKLQVALQELAGTSGSVTEGTITFDTGKAVAVPGKPGTAVDVGASADLVTKAFRDMVATGKSTPVELPVATKDPVIGKDELDRAMKDFAEPAMSAPAIVKVGTKSLPFGAKSLPKILSMQAVDGHLVEKYDLEALKATYGNTFDGILITRGTGEKTAVTPQDVAGALGKALRGKTTAERTAVIDTNAS
ncbi:hypothetical protein ACFXDJ_07765 [Streptomyces sp. NPDC059443]|uniref:hypothetical protein n=1 Tax=unclassified Streptomyces TaxID=2593676 RepID=UPI0036A3596D